MKHAGLRTRLEGAFEGLEQLERDARALTPLLTRGWRERLRDRPVPAVASYRAWAAAVRHLRAQVSGAEQTELDTLLARTERALLALDRAGTRVLDASGEPAERGLPRLFELAAPADPGGERVVVACKARLTPRLEAPSFFAMPGLALVPKESEDTEDRPEGELTLTPTRVLYEDPSRRIELPVRELLYVRQRWHETAGIGGTASLRLGDQTYALETGAPIDTVLALMRALDVRGSGGDAPHAVGMARRVEGEQRRWILAWQFGVLLEPEGWNGQLLQLVAPGLQHRATDRTTLEAIGALLPWVQHTLKPAGWYHPREKLGVRVRGNGRSVLSVLDGDDGSYWLDGKVAECIRPVRGAG